MWFNSSDLPVKSPADLGGVFIILYDDYLNPISQEGKISDLVFVMGDSKGFIFGNGEGVVDIHWKWSMTDNREEMILDRFWTEWMFLGRLLLGQSKASYLEVPSKPLILVRFMLTPIEPSKGRIVYLNFRHVSHMV